MFTGHSITKMFDIYQTQYVHYIHNLIQIPALLFILHAIHKIVMLHFLSVPAAKTLHDLVPNPDNVSAVNYRKPLNAYAVET